MCFKDLGKLASKLSECGRMAKGPYGKRGLQADQIPYLQVSRLLLPQDPGSGAVPLRKGVPIRGVASPRIETTTSIGRGKQEGLGRVTLVPLQPMRANTTSTLKPAGHD